MTWRCPRCGHTASREGVCRRCRLLYVQDPPAEAGPDQAEDEAPVSAESASAATGVPPVERLALRMPWRQQVNLPDAGEMVLGRSSEEFQRNPDASAALQVSRRHARFFRDGNGELYVEDLHSANGTYLDGVPVEGRPARLQAGQRLRLAQDLDCDVLRLNEHGEPEGD